MAERVGIGNLLGDTIDLVGTAARDFLVYTLVLGTLSAVGIAAGFSDIDNGEFGMNMGFMIDESDTIFSGLFELASFLISIVASYLLVKRYLATRNRLRGDDNRFWPYFGMAILSAIGIVVGLILIIVPGLFLLVRWSAASGFVVGAQQGVTQSLGSSWEATKGHGWAIFFAGLVLILGIVIAAGIVAGLLGLANAMVGAIVGSYIEAASGGIMAAFGIAIYCRVHDGVEEIGEVFS